MLDILGSIGGIIAAIAAIYGVWLQRRGARRADPVITPSAWIAPHDPQLVRVTLRVRHTEIAPIVLRCARLRSPGWEVCFPRDGADAWGRVATPGVMIDHGECAVHLRLRRSSPARQMSSSSVSMVLTLRWNDQHMETRRIAITITAPSQKNIATS